MQLRLSTCFRAAATTAILFVAVAVQAQTKSDDYGGLGNYPIPTGDGGSSEFQYCVGYAKRAWRVANLIEEQSITASQAKGWARDGLGKNAAAEEIQDFERLETREYLSSHALGAERFYRCLTLLRLNPEPRHKSNAEFCFRSIKTLDFVARMRASKKSQEQARMAISAKKLAADERFLDSTINLAFSGPSIAEGSTLIEDTFSSCFAEAGERQGQAQR